MIWRIMDNPQVGIAMLGVLVLAISLHEMAHAWMAYRCGDDTAARMGRMTLNPAVHFDPMGLMFIMLATFGWGRPVPVDPRFLRNYRRDSMLVAVAGPVSNILQAFVFALLMHLMLTETVLSLFSQFGQGRQVMQACFLVFKAGVFINIGLAFFNMLPIFPLDGEKVLIGLLPYEQARKMEQFRQHAMMVLFLLLASGMFLKYSILDVYFMYTIYPISQLLLGGLPL